jgi:GH15 family glucan-1,4-alpha-glucosidase
MAVSIHDHAIIGDGRSAALVASDGTIDWLAWPRFDSPSIFASLLGESGGHFRLRARDASRARRRYVDDTNVLETRHESDTGVLVCTDFLDARSEADKRRAMIPEHTLVRIARCERGEVDVELELCPRPAYGAGAATLRAVGPFGIRAEIDGALLTFRTDVPVRATDGGVVAGVCHLRAGEAMHSLLTFDSEGPAVLPPVALGSEEALARTLAYWRAWSARLRYEGPGRDAVVRSALALKLLVFAPSGAIVAAPTTSLPESPGKSNNWDYRYCWLRDASMTARALHGLGCGEEADAFVSWLLHSTRLTRPELAVLYDVYGNAPERERTLDNLDGYAESRPVRVGNAAMDQLQLDVYGEVIDAVARVAAPDRPLDHETAKMLRGFGDFVQRNWRRPDAGIWEPRSGDAVHTHSLLLSFAALDGLLRLGAAGLLPSVPRAAFERERAAIRAMIEEQAWSPRLGSYVGRIGSDELDASVLLLPWYGFIDADSPRMRATLARLDTDLGAGRGLMYRFLREPGDEEGTFGICAFWRVECLAAGAGSLEDALRAFESLLAFANDVGLYGEEIDARSGEALGNFPQAFTHVGLINAALTLSKQLARPTQSSSSARERGQNGEARP